MGKSLALLLLGAVGVFGSRDDMSGGGNTDTGGVYKEYTDPTSRFCYSGRVGVDRPVNSGGYRTRAVTDHTGSGQTYGKDSHQDLPDPGATVCSMTHLRTY